MKHPEYDFTVQSEVNFDYYAAGKRSQNYNTEMATNLFFDLANQCGVVSGSYGSWDQFWMGFYGY
jgi:hypothetical protein